MPERERSYLLVPAAGAGEGMGHLIRCIRLARQLGSRTTFLTARLDPAARLFLAEESGRQTGRRRPRMIEKPGSADRWDVILVDARRASRGELAALMTHGVVVCLDEGGEARSYAPFLIDAIPCPRGIDPANLSSPSFLDLPARVRSTVKAPAGKALVSFGGEDAGNLSGRLVEVLVEEGMLNPDQIAVVEGPLFTPRRWPEAVRIIRGVSSLARIIPQFDVVFTHFGLTALEALASGVPVIALSPTRYHARLASAAGLPEGGAALPVARRLRSALGDPQRLRRPVESFNTLLGKDRSRRLARLLRTIVRHGTPSCPVCGTRENRVIARFETRTYRTCRTCGIAYLESFFGERKKYGRPYFSAQYKAQYGRTYLEDFDSIKAASRPRARIIRDLLGGRADGPVVDVGCAYGPFLEALREADMPGFGVDVSPSAVAHVRRKVGIPALCADFENAGRAMLPRRIAAVTMWYVIEHFLATDSALRKAVALLPPGGVLAFSTPNGRGISALRSRLDFLRRSPPDHATIFSPRGLRRLLARYGLELRRIRVTGHHPERFPGFMGRAARTWPAAHRAIHAVSVLLGLGDTFEAYSMKGDQ